MKRTVNKKAILITLGSIAYVGLVYLAGFEIASHISENPLFARPYSFINSMVNAIILLVMLLLIGIFIGIVARAVESLFNWLFPKKEETK